MKNHERLLLLLTAFYLLFSNSALASCAFKQDAGYITALQSYSMPISGTISVPPDTPVGNEIYRLKIDFANQGSVSVNCTSAGQYYIGYQYLSTPLLPSNYSSTVYETGVPGIGVKFVRGNSLEDFPASVVATNCALSTSCFFTNGYWSADSRLVFVKTASNVAAGTIEASTLPTALYSFGQEGNMVSVYKVSLTGSLQITAPTCNITTASQSMTVNMGKHDIAAFTGKGAATAWKNASIQLTNCGQFYGNVPSGYTGGTFNGSTMTNPGNENNYLSITLAPLNGIEDAAKGIMKISDIPLKANGVGIQLSTTESTSGLINLASTTTQSLTKDGTQSITVPLYARYIQTGNSVAAGKANGKLEYTITYQ